MVLHSHRNQKVDHNYHHDGGKDHYVKYRSIVSSISFDAEKSETEIMTKGKWTHIGGNILRLPPIRKRFSLLHKVYPRNNKNGIYSVAFSPKGRSVALGFISGEVQLRRLFTIAQNEAAICLRGPIPNVEVTYPVTCSRFVPTMENLLFVSDLSGRIDIFDTEKICKHMLVKENNQINTIDVDATGTTIVSGGKDSLIRIYDGVTGKLVSSTVPILKRKFDADPKKYHRMRIHCIKFDPENYNTFFSGGLDGYVKMWDLRQGLISVRTMNGPCIHGDAIDSWGNVLLTGSWRASKGMDLWDITSGQHLETLVPSNRASSLDAEFYECVRFFNGGKDGSVILTGGSGTGRLEIFNVMERRIDFAVKVGNCVKSIDSTSSSVVCGSLDGICRVVKYHRIEEKDF